MPQSPGVRTSQIGFSYRSDVDGTRVPRVPIHTQAVGSRFRFCRPIHGETPLLFNGEKLHFRRQLPRNRFQSVALNLRPDPERGSRSPRPVLHPRLVRYVPSSRYVTVERALALDHLQCTESGEPKQAHRCEPVPIAHDIRGRTDRMRARTYRIQGPQRVARCQLRRGQLHVLVFRNRVHRSEIAPEPERPEEETDDVEEHEYG